MSRERRSTESRREDRGGASQRNLHAVGSSTCIERPQSIARPNNDNGNWTILYYSFGLKSLHDDDDDGPIYAAAVLTEGGRERGREGRERPTTLSPRPTTDRGRGNVKRRGAASAAATNWRLPLDFDGNEVPSHSEREKSAARRYLLRLRGKVCDRSILGLV